MIIWRSPTAIIKIQQSSRHDSYRNDLILLFEFSSWLVLQAGMSTAHQQGK
ncbi:MAG: hypothetical protein ACK4RF_08715 [Cyclobacteriaceae bacterium]